MNRKKPQKNGGIPPTHRPGGYMLDAYFGSAILQQQQQQQSSKSLPEVKKRSGSDIEKHLAKKSKVTPRQQSAATTSSSPQKAHHKTKAETPSPVTAPTPQYRFLMNRCEVNIPVKPYPTQIAIMNAITKSANKSENVLIESATGTGKSLALICATLAAARRLTAAKLDAANPHPPPLPPPPPSQSPIASQTTAITVIKDSVGMAGLSAAPYIKAEACATQQTQATQMPSDSQLSQSVQSTQATQMPSDSQLSQPTQPIQLPVHVKVETCVSQSTQPTQMPSDSQFTQQTQATQPTQFPDDQFTQPTQPTQLPAHVKAETTTVQQKHSSQKPISRPPHPIVVRPTVVKVPTDKFGNAGGFIPAGEGSRDATQREGVAAAGGDKTLVRVFYGTRTHSQVKQIVKEVRRTIYKPLTVVLASRKHYCIFDRVHDSPERDDLCVKIMMKKVPIHCPFANTEPLKKLVRKSCGSTKVPGTDVEHKDYTAYDVEDLVREGRRLESCPYLSANELVAEAELIVSPYNYIISESIRSNRKIVLNDDIVVIDEAHNISNALMDVASYDMTAKALKSACIALRTAAKVGRPELFTAEYRACLRYAARVLNAITDWMASMEPRLRKHDFERYNSCWTGPEIIEIYKSFGLSSKAHIALFAYSVDCACGKTQFNPDDISPYMPILRLSGLLPQVADGSGATATFASLLNGLSSSNTGNINKVKLYRKERMRPKDYSREEEEEEEEGLPHFQSQGKHSKKGTSDKKRKYGGGDDDDEEKAAPSVLEGPDMICATMARSSAEFILTHPEYAKDYRLIVEKYTEVTKEPPSRSNSSGSWDGSTITCHNPGGYSGGSGSGSSSSTKEWAMSLGLWCMSPSVAFEGVEKPSRSVILASGTLAPFDPLAQELRAAFPTRVELSHVIDKCQVIACTAKRYEVSYSTTDSLDVQDYIGRSILECCRVIPAGVLCFFPSYALLSKLLRRWRETGLYKDIAAAKGGNVFSELDFSKSTEWRAAGDSGDKAEDAEFSAFIARFHKCARTEAGALLFAVCRGKSSEGVDFADESARGVIVVGIPYSNTHNVRISLKREYEEAACRGAGSRWYVADGHRAVNQAIGRIIRNRWDYGAVVFLDARYARMSVRGELSKWIRNQIYEVDTVHDFVPALTDFFENIPAYVQRKKEEVAAKASAGAPSASMPLPSK